MRLFQFRKPDPARADQKLLSSDEKLVKRGFLKKLRRVVGKIAFAEDLVAAYYCAFDPKTPLRVKAILMAALAYFVVPADLVPDFLLGLGFTDDLSVLIAAISTVREHVRTEHFQKAQALLEKENDHSSDN
ncbi:YkvA family protein [Kiloniella laminariae]|uniref:YkvA family protein n=1 Tax=Kiloniella laminariae TaxID=454162 RepID=UPI0003704E1C|nr:YkvA family protein [Kiloniella laminariae]